MVAAIVVSEETLVVLAEHCSMSLIMIKDAHLELEGYKYSDESIPGFRPRAHHWLGSIVALCN